MSATVGGHCKSDRVEVDPIGSVSSSRAEATDDDWGAVVATITLDPAFDATALRGIDDFSHVEIVYAFDRVDPAGVERGARHPRGNAAWPLVGIFAQRAKSRPNRLGVSVCRLLSVADRTLTVQGLDAIDGTPVLDVKPYMAELAPRGLVRQPDWAHELMAGYWASDGPQGSSAGTRHSYDAVAEAYAAAIGDELAAKPLDRALLVAVAELAQGGPVVDVGAGPGHVAGALRELGSASIALDLAPRMASFARRSSGLPAVAGEMTALPIAGATVRGLVSLYAVIHLDASARLAAYREFARVLMPGGVALVAFHTSDEEAGAGSAKHRTEWWGHAVRLTFRFLDPVVEIGAARRAGLELVARLDRGPVPGAEHASQRTYLVLRRPGG